MDKLGRHTWLELGNSIDTLMHIESSIDVMKDVADLSFTRNKDCFAIMRIAVDALDNLGTNEHARVSNQNAVQR